MKITTLQAALSSAALLLLAQPAGATHSHHLAHSQFHAKKHAQHLHQHQHVHEHRDVEKEELKKRGICSLPDHPDLVKVPGAMNNGFAMSPDQQCTTGKYCPLACVPGKVMAQWRPNTSYSYPESMDGGLECKDGEPVKPFPDKPYCVDGTNTLSGVNQCTQVISFCQTVLPGNEAMLIPTEIQAGDSAVLAVPGPSYWASTAAHYYINPPGTGKEGCVWGDPSKPIGNWAPYVAGANTDQNGQTFVKIAWNPIWTDCPLGTTKPSYGVRIECPDGGCNGTPCEIDPSKMAINGVNSPVSAAGVGGADFCVVTVPKGKSANIVVFQTDGSKASASASSSSKPSSSAAPPPPMTTSSKAAPTMSSSTSASSSSSSSPSSSSSLSTSSAWSAPSSSSKSSSSSSYPTVLPGIFHENSTYSTGGANSGSSSSPSAQTTSAKSGSAGGGGSSSVSEPAPSVSKNEGVADQSGGAIAGLIVALVAAAALY